eukprot:6185603-Pleurochrysis_carterae.AAC.5
MRVCADAIAIAKGDGLVVAKGDGHVGAAFGRHVGVHVPAVGDGVEQPLSRHLLRRVLWPLHGEEAGVRHREVAVGRGALEGVQLHRLVGPVRLGRRQPVARPDELQKERALLWRKRLEHAPQDQNVRVVRVERDACGRRAHKWRELAQARAAQSCPSCARRRTHAQRMCLLVCVCHVKHQQVCRQARPSTCELLHNECDCLFARHMCRDMHARVHGGGR